MMTNILCMRDDMRACVTLPRSREYRWAAGAAGAAARAPAGAARTPSGTCAGDTAADCPLTRAQIRDRQALPIPVIVAGSSPHAKISIQGISIIAMRNELMQTF